MLPARKILGNNDEATAKMEETKNQEAMGLEAKIERAEKQWAAIKKKFEDLKKLCKPKETTIEFRVT